MLRLISWYIITPAKRTATTVPTIESMKGPLGSEPVAERMISDTVLNAMIAASTQRVKVRAPARPVNNKYPAGRAITPRIAWTTPRDIPVASFEK